MIQFAIYQYKGGPLIADYSARVSGVTFASNNRGYAECKAFVPLNITDTFRFYDRQAMPHLLVVDTSSGAPFEGRVEAVALADGGINITALGYARATSDFLYSALWSDTKVNSFRPVSNTEISNAANQQFTITTNVGAVVICPTKNSAMGTSPNAYVAYMVYQIPDKSSRQIVGMSFDWTKRHGLVSAGHQWTGAIIGYQSGYTSPTTLFSTGAGTSPGAENLAFAGQDYIIIAQYYDGPNSDGPYVFETGVIGFGVYNIRIVTSIVNRVNTTFTIARPPGTNVTATVGSTANMYVGQRLQLSGAIGESVTVLSIGSSTQFNATFVNGSLLGAAARAHVVYADEIAEDMIGVINTVNPTQLSASTALVQSPQLDLTDQIYVDTYHADVLSTLAGIPDTQSRLWEWGVYANQVLYFRPQNSTGRTWYIDVSSLDVQRTIDTLYNNVYAVYQDANGGRLRGTPMGDASSVARYGINRQKAITVSTTSATLASAQTTAALADSKNPLPRGGLTVRQVFDGNNARWPLWSVRAGDTMIIRNLPPTLSVVIDKIRVFRLTRAEYHIDDDTLSIEPEIPLPTLDVLLAQQALRSR